MISRKRLALFVGFLIITAVGFASEEEYIDWDNVKIVSRRNSETGKISFSARTEGDSFKTVSINVFGKNYSVGDKDLSKLKGFSLRTLTITHEAGYKETGGHTVHFRMKRFVIKSKSPEEEQILLSISVGKGLEIQGPMKK